MPTKLPTYQQLSDQLEQTMIKLQNPDCDVDEATDLYEAALQNIAQLEKHLATAKNRVAKIQTSFADRTA